MKNYILGSHQSMTYLPVRKWWMKPLAFTARCQEVPLHDQFWVYGCRMFDIRLRFDKSGFPILAHGVIEWDYDDTYTTIYHIFDALNKWAKESGDNVYVRVWLESNSEMKDQASQEEQFVKLCSFIEKVYTNIHFFDGFRKYDWKVLYQFKGPKPPFDDRYSSANNVKEDDLFPKKYAKKYNKKILEEGTDKEYLLIDYVNIQ